MVRLEKKQENNSSIGTSMSVSFMSNFIVWAKNLAKKEGRAWIIVTCGAFFYAYQFILRVSPNVMNNDIMETFMIDALAFGSVVGFYSWGYAGMQLPLGIALDRIGPRLLLAGAGLICALSCFAFAHTNSLIVASLARLVIGIGGACGLIGTLKLGTLWLEPSRLGSVIALTILFGTLGASLGNTPLSLLVDSIGWRESYQLLGFFGLALTLALFLVIRRPSDDASHGTEALPFLENSHPWDDIKQLAINPQAWVIALYGTLMYMPITIIGDAWGVRFIQKAAQVSEAEAAGVMTTMFLGAAMGSPFFTSLSDMLANRRVPMLIGSIVTSLLYIGVLLYPGKELYVFHVLFFLAGFFYTAKVLTFAIICEIMPRNMSGVSTAFVNMIVMIGGAFLPAFGWLIELRWDGQYQDGIPLYSADDLRFALMVLPICLIISIFLLKFMKETHPKSGSTQKDQPSIDVDVL